MEGDKRIDKLMIPVRAAIKRHVKNRDAITEIYNRVYEALMNSMDALDVSAAVTAKQIAENAKNLQRAEKAEAENAALRKVIQGMAPMWIAAMGYCEHGKRRQMDAMHNYYRGNGNKMTNDDIRLMFEIIPDKELK